MNRIQTNNTERENIANVLIADDDPRFVRFTLEILARKGIHGHLVKKHNIIEFINRDNCDLVIISDGTPGTNGTFNGCPDGLEIAGRIKNFRPELPVIIVSDANDNNAGYIIARAVEAIRRGCHDFLVKPLEKNTIETILDTILPNHKCSTIISEHDGANCLYQIVGKDAKTAAAVDVALKIAPTSAPVLLTGESGTGKELFACLIHNKSRRSHRPYVRINCAALSESILESELFGHEKGAFTGAYTQRKGRFEMADSGTLLLDEITETPLNFQAKLLRVLEQQEFERVGGNENVRIDVRIISTTNKDLLGEVRNGRFREDLYYRLSALRLHLPSLRERKEDLPELVWHFVNHYSREVHRRITGLDPTMMRIFTEYAWPGNIRQLRNVVRTSMILGSGAILSLADVSWLFDELQPLSQHQIMANDSLSVPVTALNNQNSCDRIQDKSLAGLSLEQIERQAILDTLNHTGGNHTKAARVLGISDRTLRDKVHRYRREGCLQPA